MIRQIPRGVRVVVILLVMLPVLWLWVARDTAHALRLWGLVVAMSLVPGLVLERIYPRDETGNVYDRDHPKHVRATVVEVLLALFVGALYIAVLALLS